MITLYRVYPIDCDGVASMYFTDRVKAERHAVQVRLKWKGIADEVTVTPRRIALTAEAICAALNEVAS
jgi:hypothetical protein